MSVVLSVHSTRELTADIVFIMSWIILSILQSTWLRILHEVVDAVPLEVMSLSDAAVWLQSLDKYLVVIASVSTTASLNISQVLLVILHPLLL